MPRTTPLDPDQRRAQLLGAARAVFARLGYHEASVADIIGEAGVARGTFYNYFESKRAVFQAVLDALTEGIAAVITPVEPDGDVAQQIRENLERVMGVLQGGDVARLLFADAVGLDAEGDEALRAFYGAGTERIVSALRRGQRMGIVRPGDPEIAARCLLGMLKEPIFLAWLRDEPLDTDQLLRTMIPLVLWGVSARAEDEPAL